MREANQLKTAVEVQIQPRDFYKQFPYTTITLKKDQSGKQCLKMEHIKSNTHKNSAKELQAQRNQ